VITKHSSNRKLVRRVVLEIGGRRNVRVKEVIDVAMWYTDAGARSDGEEVVCGLSYSRRLC